MRKLVAIGEALIDMIPSVSGVPLKDVPSFERRLGGAPTNVAGAFAMLGGHAEVLTMLGNDGFGEFILDEMRLKKIDISHVLRTDRANTALAFVSLLKDGNREFTFYRNPSSDMLLDESDINIENLKGSILHFCSVDLIDAPVRRAHIKAINAVKSMGGIVSFDPDLRFPLWNNLSELKQIVVEFSSYSDIIKVSDEEIEFITGSNDLKVAANFFLNLGAKLVFITLGKDGSVCFDCNNNSLYSKGIPQEVLDTTGAGDIFIGTALYAIASKQLDICKLKEKELQFVLDVATYASSLSVTKSGADFDADAVKDYFIRH